MKSFFAGLGLITLIAAMVYSSLSLFTAKVSASGVTCCNLSLNCEAGYRCEPAGSTSCSDPGHPHWTGFCLKNCAAGMECDEEGGGS